jgi:TRAP-type transport system periplasmic protein
MRLVWFALPALAFAVVGCASGTKAGGVGQHTIVLTIANHESDDRDLAEYMAAVSRLSEGAIKLDLRADWRAPDSDFDRGTIVDVRAGKADLAKIAVGSLDGLGVDDFQAVMAPFLIDGLALEQKVLASELPDEMLPGLQRLGVEGLAMLPGEPRRPFGLTRRLLGPLDYRDAVIGIRPSRLAAATFREFGATARTYLTGELPPWTFDGAELDLVTLEGNRYDISGSSLTANVAFWPKAFVVVANDGLLAKLTSRQREILREAGRAALGPAIARLRNEDRVEAGILCRRHHAMFVVATPGQIAALRAAVSPIYDRVERDGRTTSFIHEIEAMKRRSFAERATPCSAPTPPRRAETLLDGVWEMTARRAVAGPIDAGHYRMVLRRGRLIAVRPWKSTGTFTVRGDTVVFRNSDGEYGVYRWNLFRDTLTLRYVPGREEGAPNPTFAPWHRVGS